MSGSGAERGLERQVGEQLVVALPKLGPPPDPRVELRQLMQPDSRLDVGHVELEPGLDDLIVPEALVGESLPGAEAEPVQREPLHLRCDPRVVCHERAALDRGHILGDIERERHQIVHPSDSGAPPFGPERVRSVLDDPQPVPVAEDSAAICMSTGLPARWTGMITHVRGVTARSAASRSR